MHRFAPFTAVTFTAVTVVGCSLQDPIADEDLSQEMTAADARVVGHVHGLGVDPGDGTLYLASHYGVFRVDDGTPERVADRWQDTMGFAVIGPGHFLGSGHPDLREDLPTSLGLIESTDGAESWQSVALLGDADLHSIEPVDGVIYAYDSRSGSLVVTTDRQTWETIDRRPLYDLAADPAEPGTVYATTTDGELVRSVDQARLKPVEGAPALTGIDWEPGGPLAGVTRKGAVLVSPTGGTEWETVGQLDGQVEAFDAAPGRWHAATRSGVYESTDNGATWDQVFAHLA